MLERHPARMPSLSFGNHADFQTFTFIYALRKGVQLFDLMIVTITIAPTSLRDSGGRLHCEYFSSIFHRHALLYLLDEG